ncbi:MAG TPA: prepilin-type N-terminal cleavage/methylation domain-containing protein [Candidatus Saccharibacteria bacterium]|jgi:hypothetical protein|nr:prepilin-type N-terminal cleavage/methylation domain-containing protein [Candidatus Saccharibacteria bacterium]HMT55842.1 prepilin-type N-terminal cleavage/methylation domain-containing protein [Candidatus Saccharibacteria bacterium]
MIKKHQMNGQKGFTLVEGLLIALIVPVLGFAGYYVWSQNQDVETQQKETPQHDSKVQANDNPQTMDQIANTPDGYELYQGDEFSFVYPTEWKNIDDLNDNWHPAITHSADGYEFGGGFGPTISYSTLNENWTITKLGRFPDGTKVGDEFDLFSRTSDSGVVVYDYTVGDGPFSATTLLFVSGVNMVKVVLPDVCSGNECSKQSTYDRKAIENFSEIISKSVKLN